MKIGVESAVGFLMTLFAINICLVGGGVYPIDQVDSVNPLTTEFSDFQQAYEDNDLNPNLEVTTTEHEAADTTELLPTSVYGNNLREMANLIWNLLKGVTIGYTSIFIVVGMPVLLIWLFSGIIMLLQILSTVVVLSYIYHFFLLK